MRIDRYADCRGAWVRGNLHSHSSESSGCASVPLLAGIERHWKAGARFLAITDHDTVTDLSAARVRWTDVTFLEGFEWSSSENILFIGEKMPPLHEHSLREALRRAAGLLTVICHPRPNLGREYWTIPMILALDPPPVGIEVYNSHYSRRHAAARSPNPLYADVWDALLTKGLRVWGFTNDDSHDPADFGLTATVANVEDRSPASLMRALKAGRFYGTTGLTLHEVGMSGDAISVSLDSGAHGRFVGPGGIVLGESDGREFAFRAHDEDYIRFEAEGRAGRIFLQPFFRG